MLLTAPLAIPFQIRYVLRPRMGSYKESIVIGGDTETYEGQPMSFQFYSEDIPIEEIIWPTNKTADKRFFGFLNKLPNNNTYSIYIHNLKFDLIELFYPVWQQLGKSELELTYGNWEIFGVYQRPSFLVMRDVSNGKTVYVLDSMLWFISSLDKAAQLVCPDLPKLKRPTGIGEKRFKKGDTVFQEYAMRDAEVCYYLGKQIQGMHYEFDIAQAVSLADMSAKIFRKHFLTYEIPQPSVECMEASYFSYHGGKNNVYPGCAPYWHMDVASLDISSAYPYAMSTMPSFGNIKLYKKYKQTKPTRYPVPQWGVYRITGVVEDTPWPSLFDHGFKPLKNFVEDVWVQGHELNEAMKSKEFRPTKPIVGHYYDVCNDQRKPALKAFVDEFYELKSNANDKVQRYMYKILLNSLYGKFIQRREVDLSDDPNEPHKVMLAGGLFHPFIASGITGHTRSYIHRLEHRFEAIHTATDGIYTRNIKSLSNKIRESNKCEGVDQLGKLELEGQGDLLLLRNKLYVLYTDEKNDNPSTQFKGKYIAKMAKHGFQGTLAQLEELVVTNRRKYSIKRPNTLKESIKRGLQPNKFESRDFVMKVAPVGIYKG